MTLNNYYNKYDRRILFLILSLGFGGIGGALQVPRVLTMLFFPSLLCNIQKCKMLVPIHKFFVFFIVYSVVSLAWTPDVSEGLLQIAYYVLHYLMFCEFIVFSERCRNPLSSISWGWTLVVFFCCLIAVWELTTGNHLSMAREDTSTINVGGDILNRLNASATFGNYNGFVTFLCFAFPWLCYNIIISRKERFRLIVSFISILMTILILLIDGSRGGIFSVAVMLCMYLLHMQKNKYSLLVISLFVCSLCYFLFQYGEEILLVIKMKNEGEGLATDDSRTMIWGTAISLLINSFGFGIGIGGMIPALSKANSWIIPATHNMFLEVLLQFGVIIFYFFMRYLYKLFRKTLLIKDKTIKLVVLMSLVGMPMYSIIDSIYLLWPAFYILLATLTVFVRK